MKLKNFVFVISVFTALSTTANASEYNLFNPVPDDKLRAMSTERPSKTDGTFTIDSGRVQIETSLINYTKERNNNVKTQSSTYGGSTNIRVGLTQSSDLQIITDLFKQLRVKDETANTLDEKEGFGDTTVRYKYNFFGNDSGATSLALIPYVKIPTNQKALGNDAYEGGVELPFNINLSDGYNIGAMTVVSALQDSDNKGYNAAFTNSIIVGKSFTAKFSGYAEFFTFRNTEENSEWQNTADFGVGYAITDNFRIDTGINFGVSDYADDLNFFVGTAYRF